MGKYEERQVAEARLTDIIEDVATAMSDVTSESWQVVRGGHPHYRELGGPNGEVIGISTAMAAPGHYTISGRIEHIKDAAGRSAHLLYNEKRPSIGVSSSKEPERIAADIVSRLLSDYRELFAAVVARMEGENVHQAVSLAGAKRLAAIVGAKVRSENPDRPTLDLYHSTKLTDSTGEVWVSGEGVTFERFTVTVEEAEAMLMALIRSRLK